MPKKPKSEPDDKEQSERFIETARNLEIDESGNLFEDAFRTIAPHTSVPIIDLTSRKKSCVSKK